MPETKTTFFGRDTQARHEFLHLHEYGVVATTGTPADFLLGLKILASELPQAIVIRNIWPGINHD